MSKGKIFISYSLDDQKIADKIVEILIKNDFDVWISRGKFSNLNLGEQHEVLVPDTIVEWCDCLLVLGTINSYKKKKSYMLREIDIACCCDKKIVALKIGDDYEYQKGYLFYANCINGNYETINIENLELDLKEKFIDKYKSF